MKNPPQHRPTQQAFRAKETPAWLMKALEEADYSHLPSVNYGSLSQEAQDELLRRMGIL